MELAVRSRASGLKDTLGRGKAAPKHSGGIQPVLVDKTRASRRDSSPSAVVQSCAGDPTKISAAEPSHKKDSHCSAEQKEPWPRKSPTTAGR